MLPIVNAEGPYRASTGGVGAVVGPDEALDPMQMFKQSYSIAKQIAADRAAEDAAKRARIKAAIGEIDFSTNGIRANDAEYFHGGKQTLSQFYANALESGVNPDNPDFAKDNAHAQTIKRGYEVMVDASIDLNNKLKAASEALYKDPSKYDWEKSVASIKKYADQPLVAALHSNEPLLVPKGWNFESWAKGLFDEKTGEFTPDAKVTTEGGKIIEVKGFSEWDPAMKSFPKIQEAANLMLRHNPDFRDYAMDKYGELPPSVQDEFKSIAETATKNGNPISAEDYYAYTLLEPFGWTQKNFKGETEFAKESAKAGAGQRQVAENFQSDIDRYLLLARGDESIFQQRADGKYSQYGVGERAGTYVNEMGVEVPSLIVSVQHMGKTAEGRPIIKYKTTGTEAMAGKGIVDADGYVTTNDANDLIYPMINSKYGKDAQQYVKAYQERVKKLNAWKGGSVDPYTPEVDKLSPGYKLENVEQQAKTINNLNPDNYGKIDFANIVKTVLDPATAAPTSKKKYPWQQ